jgi:glutamate---cysteine ligase / carboxylate-amine ligase
VRTFGVEEELLLVHEETGLPMAVAGRVLRHHDGPTRDRPDIVQLTAELQQEMLEVVYPPQNGFAGLRDALRQGRLLADAGARAAGARAVALATSPMPASPHVTIQPRYQTMHARYGITAHEQLTCGFHIHVAIDSPEEGVGVIDRIRPWLPVLVALSANSPFRNGVDTGHASYRYSAWGRWASAGPNEVFGSAEQYRRFEEELLGTGVLLDRGMLYFDARLSRNHPTVEVRVADVCLLAEDAAVIATLTRALAETAAREWAAGTPPTAVSATALRLASWQAALQGLSGDLCDPTAAGTMPAATVVECLLAHVRDALEDSGDADAVMCGIRRILSSGTGADWQRAEWRRTGTMAGVVRGAVAATVGSAVA